MKYEIENILQSNKAKYLKYAGIVYIVLGVIFFIWELTIAVAEESFYYLIEGAVILSVLVFTFILNAVLYEIHTMNKFIIEEKCKKQTCEISQEAEYAEKIKTEEEKNNETLEKIINIYEDKKHQQL